MRTAATETAKMTVMSNSIVTQSSPPPWSHGGQRALAAAVRRGQPFKPATIALLSSVVWGCAGGPAEVLLHPELDDSADQVCGQGLGEGELH